MSLRNLIKIANYYEIKYGFEKESKHKLSLALSGTIEAYHVGRKLFGNAFSLDYVGSGEGWGGMGGALGPGIYFTDDENLARVYAKYHSRPYLYKVTIQADKLYNRVWGEPVDLRDAIKKVEMELNRSEDLFQRSNQGTYRSHLKVDDERVRNSLKENGISGFFVKLPGGELEICVFDLSIVEIKEKIPLLATEEEYEEQEKKELMDFKIKDSKCYWCDKQLWEPLSDISYEEKERIREEHSSDDSCR